MRTPHLLWVCLVFSLLGFAPVGAQAPAENQPVKIRVTMPWPSATLKIEGNETKQTGNTRNFVSPPIEPGRDYTYTLVAVWQPNNYTTITRTRQFVVRAGLMLEADLSKADDKAPDKIVIRYVPTPPDIVEAMLKLARVGPSDIVYDLGCGDGRIVVAAAANFKAKRGVGVDLDPDRVKESQENAKAQKVADRVEIRKGDVLDIKDLSDATVVTLYMSDAMNLRLRPILQKTLKPGSRIVSHRFTMGDWKPIKTEKITGADGDDYEVHLWEVGK